MIRGMFCWISILRRRGLSLPAAMKAGRSLIRSVPETQFPCGFGAVTESAKCVSRSHFFGRGGGCRAFCKTEELL